VIRNGPDSFGAVSRLIHWATALLVLIQLALGLRIVDMEPGLANLWLYGLHKTLGLTVLALVVLRIAWHLWSPVPRPLADGPTGMTLARVGHAAFYVLLLAVPMTGWAGSSATGLDVLFADRWVLPPLVAASAEGEAFWFRLHDVLTKALAALAMGHMLIALKHEMDGRGTLTRMLRGRR
jgi:cytochrome b561